MCKDPMHILVSSVDLRDGQVTGRDRGKPYLGMRLDLGCEEITKLICDESLAARRRTRTPRAALCQRLRPSMLDAAGCIARLTRYTRGNSNSSAARQARRS